MTRIRREALSTSEVREQGREGHDRRDANHSRARGRAVDYGELFKENGPALWRALFVHTAGRRDIADEAVAEAFTLAIESGDRIRKPLAWIYRVAFRIARSELRRQTPDALPQDVAGPETEDEEVHDLLQALMKLPPRERSAVVLHYRLGFRIREVAQILDVSVPTIKVHLHRGRRRLSQLLKANGGEL